MLVINWTSGVRLRPAISWERDGKIWYVCLRCLGVEVSLYSRKMGGAIVDMLNSTIKEECP